MAPISRLLLAMLLSLALATAAQADPLSTFDGAPADIAAYLGDGKWTVVKLWSSDCHVCNTRAHDYVAFHARHRDVDARMLGISLDGLRGIANAEAFVAQHRLNYDNLIIDWEGGRRLFYEITGSTLSGTPGFMLFSPEGRLVAQQVGAVPIELIETFIGSVASVAMRR